MAANATFLEHRIWRLNRTFCQELEGAMTCSAETKGMSDVAEIHGDRDDWGAIWVCVFF